MKGLSIEQKAKAYDEAIERANSLLSSNELGNAWIYKLLPELKESEDERIRKAMIDYFKWNPDGQLLNEFSNREVFAWLEKQSGQTPAWSEEDEIIRKSLINMVEKFYGRCDDKSARNRFTYWLNYLKNRIQPQSQWKPSDKDIFELQCVINNDPYNGFILKALLEQLKKLGKE
jgi:hypothetical protein